jgi:predicted nucleic acid-binding protein
LKILLDTTYLLPSIGVALDDLPSDVLLKLLSNGHEITINQICLFELAAKGAKLAKAGRVKPETVIRAMSAIVHSDRLRIISPTETKVVIAAFELRKLHDDFIDCLIASTALCYCDVLLTEDREIHDLKSYREFTALSQALNPNFKMGTLSKMFAELR